MAGATEKLAAKRTAKVTAKPAATTATTTPPAKRRGRPAKAAAAVDTTPPVPTKAARTAAKPATATAAKAAKPTRNHDEAVEQVLTTKAEARRLFAAGSTRREIAEALGVAYATVYAHTGDMKDAPGAAAGRARVFVESANGGEKISRSAAMREDYNDGMSIGDIGRKYGVIYQVAYQAVKSIIVREDEE